MFDFRLFLLRQFPLVSFVRALRAAIILDNHDFQSVEGPAGREHIQKSKFFELMLDYFA